MQLFSIVSESPRAEQAAVAFCSATGRNIIMRPLDFQTRLALPDLSLFTSVNWIKDAEARIYFMLKNDHT